MIARAGNDTSPTMMDNRSAILSHLGTDLCCRMTLSCAGRTMSMLLPYQRAQSVTYTTSSHSGLRRSRKVRAGSITDPANEPRCQLPGCLSRISRFRRLSGDGGTCDRLVLRWDGLETIHKSSPWSRHVDNTCKPPGTEGSNTPEPPQTNPIKVFTKCTSYRSQQHAVSAASRRHQHSGVTQLRAKEPMEQACTKRDYGEHMCFRLECRVKLRQAR